MPGEHQHCIGCGRYGRVELHHLAGRCNIPDLVVPVCGECHLILTNWQYAAGIELRADIPRGPLDIRRALGVGFLHLARLILVRTGDPAAMRTADVWAITARAISKVLDLSGALDRAGRWLPDSYVEPRPAPQVVIDPRSDEAQVRELTYLVGKLLRLLGDMPAITVEVWERITADPRSLMERFAAIDAGDHLGPSIAALISEHLDASEHVMQWVLTLEDWSHIDDYDLNEVRVYFDTGRRLLDKIARAALTGPQTP